MFDKFKKVLSAGAVLSSAIVGLAVLPSAQAEELRDLNYGAVLFEFYQQNYFDALIEYAYADEKGGIENHGNYPELLKGGISFSYGLHDQARKIFDKALAGNLAEQQQNRVWYYVAKMAYENGDLGSAGRALTQINGALPVSIQADYVYLASLVHVHRGNFEAAEAVYQAVSKNNKYAPYVLYNLGIAQTQLGKVDQALKTFKKATQFSNNQEHKAIADRANLALNFLYERKGAHKAADNALQDVHNTGLYSNRALLTYSWLAINDGAYKRSLSPLKALSKRSIAIAEVQEAILLVPHVYERLNLKGRAQQGFIAAGKEYQRGLAEITQLRQQLQNRKKLWFFVDTIIANERGILQEYNEPLSPYMLTLLTDHTFQAVLKEIEDLKQLKVSLNKIIAKESPLKQIIDARNVASSKRGLKAQLQRAKKQHNELIKEYSRVQEKVEKVGDQYSAKDKKRVEALMDTMAKDINFTEQTLEMLEGEKRFSNKVSGFKRDIDKRMALAKRQQQKTDRLLKKLHKVMYKLISNELDMHQQRFKYYLVQSRLAKARLYDSVLQDIDPLEEPKASGQ